MPIHFCHICSHECFDEPLLYYKNMPKISQFLPRKEDIFHEKGAALSIYQCAGCGLVQLDSDPVPYYREVIRASGFSKEMSGFRQNQFDQFTKKYGLKGKKGIEIGCGRGEYLSLIQKSGIDAYGLEYSQKSVNACLKQQLKAQPGFIETSRQPLSNAPFDVFFILSFLEHLPNVNSVLKGIAYNLTPDGIGIVEVPNFNMILQNNLFSEFTRDHLFYFTKETLTFALEYNGFEVIKCQNIWYDYIISAVVKKRKSLDLSDFHQHQRRLQNSFDQYLKRFRGKNVAIWGAGHQALALISMLNLSNRIKYVVDSAPFKQDKYTPATHLPIVAPTTLNFDPVEAVIVMAASYSDEVVRILQKEFNQNLKIAVLRDNGLEIVR